MSRDESRPFTTRRTYLQSLAGVAGGAAIFGQPVEGMAAVESPLAEEDLISWWPFDEDFRDAVGDNHASVPIGEPQIDTVDGQTGVVFDGDDGLRVARGGNEPELSLLDRTDGPASITMWVYFAEQTGGEPFEGTGTPRHSILNNDTGYRIAAVPQANGSNVNLRFSVSPYGGDSDANGYSMPDDEEIPLSINEWHHLSFVFNSTEYIRIYVDSEEVFADDSMEGYNNPATDFWPDITIGSWYGGDPEEWANLMDGSIADLRIYDTELTPDEISQIYTNTSSGNTPTTTASSPTDTQTTTTLTEIDSLSLPARSGLAYNDGSGYVLTPEEQIFQFDIESYEIESRIPAPDGDIRPVGLAYGAGSLWFSDGVGPDYDGEILELDPETGAVRSRIETSYDPRGLAFGGGSLWVADITGNNIVEYTPDGTRQSSFSVPTTTPQGLAYYEGSLWLGDYCYGDSSCVATLYEFGTDGNLKQKTNERDIESGGFGALATTETELLGTGTDGTLTVLRTFEDDGTEASTVDPENESFTQQSNDGQRATEQDDSEDDSGGIPVLNRFGDSGSTVGVGLVGLLGGAGGYAALSKLRGRDSRDQLGEENDG